MKITIANFGSRPPVYVLEGLHVYVKRIQNYLPIEVKEYNIRSFEEEMAALVKMINKDSNIILLSEDGELSNSPAFAHKIQHWLNSGKKNLIFVVGNAHGFHEKTKQMFPLLSLSPLTLNHHHALLILAEQIYRALTILHNHPYHH